MHEVTSVLHAYFTYLDDIGAYKKINFLCRSSHLDSQTRGNQEPAQDIPARKIGLLARPFGLGWRDRNKVQFHCFIAPLNS
jgi:hypothetical protein